MKVNLLIPAILSLPIYIKLYCRSKGHDRKLLLFAIIGNLILIFGEYQKMGIINKTNTEELRIKQTVQISHIMFVITAIFGSIYYKENHNLYFTIFMILLYYITNIIFNGCLFRKSADNYKFKIEQLWKFINWDFIFYIAFFACIINIKN